jgi:WhiB family redox-sensing transcriptional regulator
MADLRGLPGSSTEKWRWQRHGACRGANPELFFHPDGKRGPGHRRREQAAAAICRGCPVVADCRAHALAAPEPHGFWGGLSESEREAIRTGSAGDPARACCRRTPA